MKPFLILLCLLAYAVAGTICFFAVPAHVGLLILAAMGNINFLALAILAALADKGRGGE